MAGAAAGLGRKTGDAVDQAQERRAAIEIRDAREEDLPGLLAIFNQVIETSTAVYRRDPALLEDRRAWWLARRDKGFPVTVAHDGREVLGFASFGPYRDYWGYRFSVEHTVHVRADQRGGGVGAALMKDLIARAEAMGMHTLIAVIDAENAGSIRFHERFGFRETGRLREVGHKFGRYLDTVFLQLWFGGGAEADVSRGA